MSDSDGEVGIPTWASAPLEAMLNQSRRLAQVLDLSRSGINSLRHSHTITALVLKHRPRGEAEDASAKERAAVIAELASREIEEDFPVLHGQAVVTLWAYLEACIRRLVAEWVKNDKSCLTTPPFAKLRVKLAEYEGLDAPDRCFYIVDALERDLSTDLQHGVTRFESLLAALDLSGEVPDRLRRSLYELGQVRNVIVHRGSITDRKFAESCPWLGLKPGCEIKVPSEVLSHYTEVVHDYLTLVICRLADRFGSDATDDRREIFRRWAFDRDASRLTLGATDELISQK